MTNPRLCQLRDLFTLYPHTSCHTHDLLACSCTALSDSQNFQETNTLDEAEMEDDDEDQDEQQVSPRGFMVASQIKAEALPKIDDVVSSPMYSMCI